MSYKHLTIEDRSKIEVLYQQSYSANQIAEAIGRHRSTIYRELKRVKSASYDAQLAQDNALKMPDRSKESVLSTVNQLIQSFPKEALKSFTSGRG